MAETNSLARSECMPFGVEPPDSATVNEPLAPIAALASFTNCWAAAANSSAGVGKLRTSSVCVMRPLDAARSHFGTTDGPPKVGVFVHNGLLRHGFKQVTHSSLVENGVEKNSAPQLW